MERELAKLDEGSAQALKSVAALKNIVEELGPLRCISIQSACNPKKTTYCYSLPPLQSEPDTFSSSPRQLRLSLASAPPQLLGLAAPC